MSKEWADVSLIKERSWAGARMNSIQPSRQAEQAGSSRPILAPAPRRQDEDIIPALSEPIALIRLIFLQECYKYTSDNCRESTRNNRGQFARRTNGIDEWWEGDRLFRRMYFRLVGRLPVEFTFEMSLLLKFPVSLPGGYQDRNTFNFSVS